MDTYLTFVGVGLCVIGALLGIGGVMGVISYFNSAFVGEKERPRKLVLPVLAVAVAAFVIVPIGAALVDAHDGHTPAETTR